MNSALFDTCFLIDLEREIRRGSGKAHQYLVQNPNLRPCISWVVAGEFAEGFGDIHHPACSAMLVRFDILPMDEKTANYYAVQSSRLRASQQQIGTNDLWIACAGLAYSMPVVTNNSAHFGRVIGLSVIGY